MAKEKFKKIEMVSFTYKVNGKKHTAKTSAEMNELGSPSEIRGKDLGFDNSCGPDCRCVNGLVQRFVTFGGVGQWMQTNEPC